MRQPGRRQRQAHLRRRDVRGGDLSREEDSRIRRAVSALGRLLPHRPRIAVVLGSGLGDLDLGRAQAEIDYGEIPGFPRVRVAGHPGRLSLVGPVALLRGRVHFYEGSGMEDVVRPVRVMARLGVATLILTNAAGALSASLRPGDLMLVRDHLNLMGENPLRGGPNFLDLSAVYATPRIPGLKRGVYAALSGPTYETPAEARMLRRLGADAVGMSTVPEAIAARQEGLRVIAISLITNRSGSGAAHEEVLSAAARARPRLAALLRDLLRRESQESGLRGRP